MRIAVVWDHGLPPESVGGIQNHAASVSQVLAARGHRVEVFTPARTVADHPFNVHAIKPSGSLWYGGYFSALWTYLVVYRRLLGALRRDLDGGFDAVFAYNPFMSGRAASKLAREKNIPSFLCYTFSHTADYYLRGKRFSIAETVGRFGVRGHRKVVVHAEVMKRALVSKMGVDERTIEVLPLAADVSRFSPDVPSGWVRQKFGIPPGVPLILFVGRVEKLKGLHVLIEAAAQVFRREDAWLLVVGDGSQVQNMKLLAESMGIGNKTVFAGAASENDLPAFYCAADLVVYPGLDECYSLVVLEAAACGKAILGTDHPIMVEEFAEDGKAAATHEKGNADSLARVIVELLRDPRRRREMGEYARQKVVAKHTYDHYVDRLLALWEASHRE